MESDTFGVDLAILQGLLPMMTLVSEEGLHPVRLTYILT